MKFASILDNFLAGKDEESGFESDIFRDSKPEYGITKLYKLLLFSRPLYH